jgi:hypothetical protein
VAQYLTLASVYRGFSDAMSDAETSSARPPSAKLQISFHLFGLFRAFPVVTQADKSGPPEAPYYVYPENSGFETQKMAISLSGNSGFELQKG